MGGGILTEADFTEPRSATVVQVRSGFYSPRPRAS